MSDNNSKNINVEHNFTIDKKNVAEDSNTNKNEVDIGIITDKTEKNVIGIEQSKKLIQEEKMTKKNSKEVSKGHLLEYRLKRLIFSMGYFPKIGIVLKTSQEEPSDDITDLDVYGFYIHKNFASKTIWADCKAGQAKPLERISWIIGVKNIAQIDDVIFVKKGVRYSTRQFARRLNVEVLDLEIIEKLERDFGIELNDWRGSWNPDTQMNQLVTFQRINIPNSDAFKKIGNFMYSGYWMLDNYTKIKKTITGMKQLSEFEQFPLAKEQIKSIHWATFELINLFVLAILNISKELYYFSDKDKKDTILEGLISGTISTKKRTEIVEATYKIAYSIVQRQIPDFKGELQIPRIGLNPPKYFEALNDLVLRITNNPLNYFDILRFLDFVFMEYDLQSKEIDENVLRSMFPNYDNLVISAKTIIHFICTITGMRRDLFQLIR
jgi:hypothetical protein